MKAKRKKSECPSPSSVLLPLPITGPILLLNLCANTLRILLPQFNAITTVARQSRHPSNLLYSSRAILKSNSRNTNPAPQHRYEDSEPELEEGSDDEEEAEESASASDEEEEEEEEEATKAPGMTSTSNSPTQPQILVLSYHIIIPYIHSSQRANNIPINTRPSTKEAKNRTCSR